MGKKELFIEVLTWISFLLGIAGIVFYYLRNYTITYICAGISIFHSVINVLWGDQKGFGSEIVTVIIGILVALIFKCSFWPCLAVAVCYGEILICLGGLIAPILWIRTALSHREKK